MAKLNKKTQKLIKQIKSRGFKPVDDYWLKGSYRFKFEGTSYRYEHLIDTHPMTWVKINGQSF